MYEDEPIDPTKIDLNDPRYWVEKMQYDLQQKRKAATKLDPVNTLSDLCDTKVELLTSASPRQEFVVERLSPVCSRYEQILLDIIEALRKSGSGEVALPSDPLGLQPSTLRLNLREARNGFKAGVKSSKLPPDFDLDRLEFSLSRTCRGVTIRDAERSKGNVAAIGSVSFKSDYDFGVVGYFDYSEGLANLIVALQKACGGTASIYGAAKFKVASDAELQQLKAVFKETAVSIRIRDGLVEVAV